MKRTNDDIKEALREMFGCDEEILDKIVLFENPSYTEAVVGISEDHRLIYDFDLMVESLGSNTA